MYQELKRTCTAIVLLIKPFGLWRSRCRRRRGLLKPGFHIIVRIVRIVPVVSKKMFRRPGRSYGNATQTIANDPDDWDDLDRLDRIEFYPNDRGDRVNFESPGSFAIVWVVWLKEMACVNHVPRVFVPPDQRSENESSGSNHFETTEFCPSGFTAQSASLAHAWNGCSQGSCSPTAGQGEWGLWGLERNW